MTLNLGVDRATKSSFISFDYDNDNDLRGDLVAQASRPEELEE